MAFLTEWVIGCFTLILLWNIDLAGTKEQRGSSQGANHSTPLSREGCTECCPYPHRPIMLKKERQKSDHFTSPLFTLKANLVESALKGYFQCSTSGIYFFNFNIHTWGRRETYIHLLLNGSPRVVLYAQADFRGIMQSQSVLLSLHQGDKVWLKLHALKSSDTTRTVLNGIYSHMADVSITFNGHLAFDDD
uniref:C1q domain-containing protein n=1 Tax=Eptatretus burgeri TaxID=7764 RepID=A0A8C4R1U6_EPTBU